MDDRSYEIGLRAFHGRERISKKQEDVSESIGVSQATYSRFESGLQDIPFTKAIKLSEYLGVPIGWLAGEKSLPQLTDSERLEVEKFIKYTISLRNK